MSSTDVRVRKEGEKVRGGREGRSKWEEGGKERRQGGRSKRGKEGRERGPFECASRGSASMGRRLLAT